MGKVYGIHDIELHPGIDEKSFVKFFNRELAKAYADIGWKVRLLKGDRGQRKGKYAVMFEIASREARDRMSPAPGEASEENRRWYDEHKEQADELTKKWYSFSPTDTGAHQEYTDYLELK
jgi:hypothetical protein